MKKNKQSERTRNFATILYPDSLPDDWMEYLKSLHIPAAISPLHVPGKKGDSELKPHYHLFLKFDSVKTIAQVKDILEFLNCANPQIVNSPSSYVRYLIHKDNPEKQQFKNGFDDISCICGFDLEPYKTRSTSELNALYLDIFQVIKSCDIREFSQLIDYYLDVLDFETVNLIRANSFFFTSYLNSKRYRRSINDVFN